MGSNTLDISEADNRILPEESTHVSHPNRQTDVDMHEEEESGLPPKRPVGTSKFVARRHRHGGLVHQGSYQGGKQMAYSKTLEEDEPDDQDMKDEEIILAPEDDEDADDQNPNLLLSAERREQIRRIKDLRQQRRKRDDYLPIDEATSEKVEAATNRIDNFEAQILQKQLIAAQYGSQQERQGLPKLSSGIVDADHFLAEPGHLLEEEDEAEIEALIKQRVKQGSGREYEAIVKKDIVNYQRVSGLGGGPDALGSSEYAEITKYEASKTYRQVVSMMEDEDTVISALDKEIDLMKVSIERNENKIEEIKRQEVESSAKIAEANLQFTSSGEAFILAKQACEMIETLKEMLTEKQEVINELIVRRYELERKVGRSAQHLKISHIADLFKEAGETQQPYSANQYHSDDLDKIIKDSQMKYERKIFRQVNQQLDDESSLWQSITDQAVLTVDYYESAGLLVEEAEEAIFGDVDEPYSSLKLSLLQYLVPLIKLQDFRLSLNDLLDYILPYLQYDFLSFPQGMLSFEITETQAFKDLQLFLYDQNYSEYEQAILTSSLTAGLLHNAVMSFISNMWNPYDQAQNASLSSWLRKYTDLVYVPKPSECEPGEFGLKFVKDTLNAVITRLKAEIDLFHLTQATSVSLALVNAIDSLAKAILAFKDLLPEANLVHLLLDQLLLDNFLKSLGKRLHRISADSQVLQSENLATDLERIQLAFDYVFSTEVRAFIGTLQQESESLKRYKNVLRELEGKGLKVVE